ncbi:hypothetical protein [Qipengyuania aquimaris]|uniref:hypothetical protein n=1 Tax=Qipengyuania aquimaris TaxID=255984 RepID=UPI00136B9318|nr:hypothetical protein [Qipengyuania aquimaris]
MAGRASTIGLLLCIAALTGCGDRFPDYNYKMTVYAGEQQFSSVRHVKVTEGVSIVSRKVEGEAVVIDRNGRTYYALLSRADNADYDAFVAGMALRDHVPRDDVQRSEVQQAIDEWYEEHSTQDSFGDAAEFLQAMVKVEGAHDLPRTLPPRRNREPMQAWPMFVTFSNPSDPRTVREVSPEVIGIDRITIEITDEDVTTGIEERLPYGGKYSAAWREWRSAMPLENFRSRLARNDFVKRPRD